MGENQQLPEVVSPSPSLCTPRGLQFPSVLPPLMLGRSLLKPSCSLHLPTLVLDPPFLLFPHSFLLKTCEAVLVARYRFFTLQPTAHTLNRRRSTRTWSIRSRPLSFCVRFPSAFNLARGFSIKGPIRRRFVMVVNEYLRGLGGG